MELHKTGLTIDAKPYAAPDELNLSNGLVATLIDRIVMYKNKDANCNVADPDEQRQKQRATAEERLRCQDKRIYPDLLASASCFHLGSDGRNHVKQRADAANEKEYNVQVRKKDEYDALLEKVEEIKLHDLPYDNWNTAQLKSMVKWYKRDGDIKLPNRKKRTDY
jgi:hypothetical protein